MKCGYVWGDSAMWTEQEEQTLTCIVGFWGYVCQDISQASREALVGTLIPTDATLVNPDIAHTYIKLKACFVMVVGGVCLVYCWLLHKVRSLIWSSSHLRSLVNIPGPVHALGSIPHPLWVPSSHKSPNTALRKFTFMIWRGPLGAIHHIQIVLL